MTAPPRMCAVVGMLKSASVTELCAIPPVRLANHSAAPFAAGMKTQEDFGYAFTPELMAKHNIVGQGLGAEMIADQWEIPRSELDELAMRSHKLAHQATEEGRFEREIVPISVNGDTYVTDQGIRPDTNLEALSQLKPVFKEDGKITAGNSSQISDGAAAVVVMSAEAAERAGVRALAEIGAHGNVAGPDNSLHSQPSNAIRQALGKAGLGVADLDLIEINEAFAAVAIQSMRDLKVSPDVVNVNGGAIAIGHPIGASGARLAVHLCYELGRRGGGILPNQTLSTNVTPITPMSSRTMLSGTTEASAQARPTPITAPGSITLTFQPSQSWRYHQTEIASCIIRIGSRASG